MPIDRTTAPAASPAAAAASPLRTARRWLRRMRGRARASIAIEALAVAAATFAGFALLSYVLDRGLRLEVGYRLALLVMLLALLARVLRRRLLAPLRVRLTDDELALVLERADPRLEQALISALQFDADLQGPRRLPESRQMMARVVEEAGRGVAALAAAPALDRARVRRYSGVLLATAAALATTAALAPEQARLWALRNLALGSSEWPRATRLFVIGGDGPILVPKGDDVTIVARAEGVVPDQVWLRCAFASGERAREPMAATGERELACTLRALLEPGTVRAEGGDGESAAVRIEIVERPLVHDLRVTVAFPAYLQREPVELGATAGDVLVPRGSELRLAARASKPLAAATLTHGQEQRVALTVAADGVSIQGVFAPAETGPLTLHVLDRDRLDAAQPPRLLVRVVDDQLPKGRFTARGVGVMITPIARIPGQLELGDDFGLREVGAEMQVVDSAEQVGQGAFAAAAVSGLEAFVPGERELRAAPVFDLRPADATDPAASIVAPEQLVVLRYWASDDFAPGLPHRGVTDPVVFRVVTREKLLEDLTRRQGEQRRELSQVVEREQAALVELREILSPVAQDPRAAAARLRVLALSRDQQALGKRVRAISDTYGVILDEYLNNRVLEPSAVGELRGQIVAPLLRAATGEFPPSAAAVADFAAKGTGEARGQATESYEAILRTLLPVLASMAEAESFAALLEGLRETMRMQGSAMREAEQRRGEEASRLFDKPGPDKPPK